MKTNGRIFIFDRFIPEGERPSFPRRAVNPLARLIFADLNRSLEPMLAETELEVEAWEPFMAGISTITTARLAPDA